VYNRFEFQAAGFLYL